MTASTRSRIVSLNVLTAMASDLVHAVTTFMKKSSSVGASVKRLATAPGPGDAALAHDGDARAELVHVAEDVRVEEHGLAALVQALDDALDLDAADRVEPGHRLVEQHELGVVDERLGDADALQHALGVLAQVRVGGALQADVPEQGLDALAPAARVEAEQPARRSPGTRARRGSRRSTGSPAGSRRARRPATPSSTEPEVGRIEPERDLDRGRLAGAVGAEQPEHVVRRRPRGRRP